LVFTLLDESLPSDETHVYVHAMRRIRSSHRVDARRNRVCKSTSKWARRRRSVAARAAPAATEGMRALRSNQHTRQKCQRERHTTTTPAGRHGNRRADGSLPKGPSRARGVDAQRRPAGQVKCPRRAAERVVAAAVTQERARARTGADRQPTPAQRLRL